MSDLVCDLHADAISCATQNLHYLHVLSDFVYDFMSDVMSAALWELHGTRNRTWNRISMRFGEQVSDRLFFSPIKSAMESQAPARWKQIVQEIAHEIVCVNAPLQANQTESDTHLIACRISCSRGYQLLIRGRLHVYESVYESPYDFMYDLHDRACRRKSVKIRAPEKKITDVYFLLTRTAAPRFTWPPRPGTWRPWPHSPWTAPTSTPKTL
jgi:hypothetical protein